MCEFVEELEDGGGELETVFDVVEGVELVEHGEGFGLFEREEGEEEAVEEGRVFAEVREVLGEGEAEGDEGGGFLLRVWGGEEVGD